MQHRYQQVDNLSLDDFWRRYLVVDDIWIALAENMLIEMFAPVWNTTIIGFGSHAPGKGRHNQKRSAWDTLHPGRPWAAGLPPNAQSEDEIIAMARNVIHQQQAE
ncbi:Eco29kI family restriction endonuclease [Chloroflexus sp.]|uniref:Eco29kI family restriction endonuclease n=1 Tax=Chloroflexus sp. TaxID=1904827 RepID=UPI002603E746|nr:Eco29kI family restriction endonuclease [uncultured Chloroflexus sp.]